jgi:UDP-N-acetylmuramate: L-alanyl-gamma-D-glutamyl-meso-diaminopimelate ligase
VYSPPELAWDAEEALATLGDRARICGTLEQVVDEVTATAASGDHLLVMSNGGFGGIHQRLLDRLAARANGR